uniref:Uncharacterized protein n=1 Tax=Timema poppense TaxID=170557 RepID=A0A7R9H0Z2_TIMPO|nr:unnamed protein product [Timema poppensis]
MTLDQILNYEEIANIVAEDKSTCDYGSEEDDDGAVEPSQADAFNALETLMSWLERQPECTIMQRLFFLPVKTMIQDVDLCKL